MDLGLIKWSLSRKAALMWSVTSYCPGKKTPFFKEMIKWEHLQKEPGGTSVKRMDWWEGTKSPLSTNTEGGRNGFWWRRGSQLTPNNHQLSIRKGESVRERDTHTEWIIQRQWGCEPACRICWRGRRPEKTQWRGITDDLRFLTSFSLFPIKAFWGKGRGAWNQSEIELKREDSWEHAGSPQRETGRSSQRQTHSVFAALDWEEAGSFTNDSDSCGGHFTLIRGYADEWPH